MTQRVQLGAEEGSLPVMTSCSKRKGSFDPWARCVRSGVKTQIRPIGVNLRRQDLEGIQHRSARPAMYRAQAQAREIKIQGSPV